MPVLTPKDTLYSIAAVERETGLSKDTLRVWERRYGFPEPQRNANDERMYPHAQLEKLRLIRHLMDHGHRPSAIIKLDIAALSALIAGGGQRQQPPPLIAELLTHIKTHDPERLRSALLQALMKQGLQRFVTDVIAPLNYWIGEGWMHGEIAIFHEHLYSEFVQNILRNAIVDQPAHGSTPRVLLTSLPGERHRIGLLMVEALLTVEGAACVALGSETPVLDIAQAVEALSVDVVALSFSAVSAAPQAMAGVQQLREALPASAAIWIGGEGVSRTRKSVPGVSLIRSFDELLLELAAWRRRGSTRIATERGYAAIGT